LPLPRFPRSSQSGRSQSLDSRRPLGTPLTGHTGFIYTVAFSPDGTTLATGSNDNSAILWDIRDIQHPQRLGPALTGHTAQVSSVAFSPDGKHLATGSDDNTTIIWDITAVLTLRDHATETACTRSDGGFTPEQWDHYVGNLPYENSCDIP
jgi:WD40 repeat protein